eukprot:573495-Hanusia_phi.AAC.1
MQEHFDSWDFQRKQEELWTGYRTIKRLRELLTKRTKRDCDMAGGEEMGGEREEEGRRGRERGRERRGRGEEREKGRGEAGREREGKRRGREGERGE